MKKIFFFIILSLIVLSPLHADIDEIVQKGYILVGVYHNDSFPFFFHDKNGKLTGFDIEIAKEIGKELGVKVKFDRSAKTFDDLTKELVDKKVDIVVSWFSRTLTRAKQIKFSKPYFVDYQCFVINRLKAAQKFQSNNYLIELNKKTMVIGTAKGTSYVNFLKKILPFAQIKLYDSWEQCYNDIVRGNLIAGLWAKVGILNSFRKSPESGINVKFFKLPYKDFIAIGMNPDDEQLYYWINVFLTLKKYNFTPEELMNKYFLQNKENSK